MCPRTCAPRRSRSTPTRRPTTGAVSPTTSVPPGSPDASRPAASARRTRGPMPDDAAARAFIDDYRRTFESFDVAAITAMYSFPVQVVGEADGVSVVSVPTPEGWSPQVERIVGAY